ncbi:MAG: sensor histidine kinase [Hyphomicrobiaceae bacterium]|nr:sensor histidine kinase [Hyphomicrobiaceae bacterium]
MRFNSLAFRLFATSTIWTLVVLPLAGLIIYSLYREDVQVSFDGQLKKLVTAIAIDSISEATDRPVPPTNRYEPLFEVTHSGWYWQLKPLDDPSLPTLVSASLATAKLPSPAERKFPTDVTGTRWMNVTGPNDEPTRIVELVDTLGHDPNQPRYSIIVAGPLDWLDALISNFRYRLSIALALAGLGLVAVTLFQVRFGLLPLKRVENGLSAIRSGKAERLEGELPAEIAPLQVELNALIQSNQDVVDRARTQVGNLAHALKTPLAVIINETRDEDSSVARKVVEQAGVMRDSITLYLDRARMAARVGAIGRVTSVAEVTAPLVRALERINRDRGIAIEEVISGKPQFQGERQDLEEMLGNLLDNACKWAKSRVYLTVNEAHHPGKTADDGMIEIVVEDDGPGLTDAQRQRLGKRGLRLDESKPGSGLGLSIVTDLVQLYRGSLNLSASQYGGLKATLKLPRA